MNRRSPSERDRNGSGADGGGVQEDDGAGVGAESAGEPETAQPGVGGLLIAVEKRLLPHVPGRAALRRDAVAGLGLTAANVPDGMANALLVGVNPLLGLYATIVGPIVGALFSSTRLMVVTTTAAASLTAGQALGDLTGTEREGALSLLVVLVGGFLLLFGALRLGRLTRFVSYSVMTGFLMGVGALIVLSQLPNVTGYAAEGGNATARFFDLLANLDQIHVASASLGLLTLVLAVLLPRTRLGNFGILAALVVTSVLAALLGLDRVRTVSDVGTIAAGIPTLQLPSLAGGLGLVSGAFSVALIVAVQAAGVSQNVPNPGGSRSSTSRDFAAMGVADVASGLLRGLPVGGSLSATALSLLAGACSRWAAGFAGVFMAIVVIGFPQAVAPIIMPALGALLLLAGARTLRPAEALSIWRTGWTSRVAIVTTFLAMIFLPIQAAVGIGVALSALLYLTQSAADVSLLKRVEREDGSIEESSAPRKLSSCETIVLHVYGNLFYAGARTLERQLPDPRGTRHPVVILRLRGRRHVGATLLDVLARYIERLREADGRLYLTELSKTAHDEIVRTRKLNLEGAVRSYETTPIVGEATREALADARAWLERQGPEERTAAR